MRSLFLISILSAFLFNSTSCSNHKESEENLILQEKPIEIDDYGESECISINLDTSNKKIYPFAVSDKIIIHSFSPVYDSQYFSTIENDTFNLKGIEESKELTPKEINDLYLVLYGYKTKRKGNTVLMMACYNPHHTIVFYRNNKPIEFIEICIECKDYKTHKKTYIDFCNEKWCNLFKYFKSIGLTKTTPTLENRCEKDKL